MTLMLQSFIYSKQLDGQSALDWANNVNGKFEGVLDLANAIGINYDKYCTMDAMDLMSLIGSMNAQYAEQPITNKNRNYSQQQNENNITNGERPNRT
jgi:hypothetical protein